MLRRLFSFPDPVNEVSARLVAGFVVLLALATVVSGVKWLTIPLAYGFAARALTGPSLSPLGQLVTRVITPRLGVPPKLVPGPPKRFAQGVGVEFSATALVLAFTDHWTAARVVLALLIVAAVLESVFAYCLGCKVFALLMRAGVVPAEICERCNDISLRADSGQPGDRDVDAERGRRTTGEDAAKRRYVGVVAAATDDHVLFTDR